MTFLRLLPAILSGFVVFSAPAAVAQEGEGAVQTGSFGDWLVHTNAGDGPKTCFAASQPKIKEPAGANRSKIVLYISAWPKEGVKAEVSIKQGYPIKPGSPVSVTVGSDKFELFSQDDRAFVKDATDELKLIEAMKKGTTIVVQAVSGRGTETKDTYSLKGLGQALQAVAAACP